MQLPLIVAVAITFLVVFSGFFAIFDLKPMGFDWKKTLTQFQTFFSVLSMLAASLFAYCAGTSMTREVRRKNAEEQSHLRHNNLTKITLAVEMVRAESNATLYQLHRFSDGYAQKEISVQLYGKLSIAMPQQLLEIMDNLSSLPESMYLNLSHLILFIQKYNAIHHDDMDVYSEKIESVKETRAQFREYIQSGSFDSAQKEWADEFIRQHNVIYEKSTTIIWYQTGDLLEKINGLALVILKDLPLSQEWKIHDQAPYPSELVQKEIG